MQKTNILLSTSVVLSPALNYNLLKNIKKNKQKNQNSCIPDQIKQSLG